MIKDTGLIQAKDFKVGLFTRSDIINSNPDLSPNCMDVKWYFDDSIGKRLGASSTNSIFISSNLVSGFIIQNSLTNNLTSYFKLDEASGTRGDVIGTAALISVGNVLSISGIRGQAASMSNANSQAFYMRKGEGLIPNTSAYTVASWFYFTSSSFTQTLISMPSNLTGGNVFSLGTITDGSSALRIQYSVRVNLAGASATLTSQAIGLNTWNNVIFWASNNSHIGINVNLTQTTSTFVGSSLIVASDSIVQLGGAFSVTSSSGSLTVNGRMDEIGTWARVLSNSEITNLYAGGSGNTYSGGNGLDPWYSFDFGASGVRWYTVCVGSGIVASSNLGTTFLSVATSRTQSYQYLDRSRNVLIATSDAYDPTLYWAGSAGTFFATVAPNSAPNAKFSINYQGFLILLNYMNSNGIVSNRGFTYEDENTQLSGTWTDRFDLPSSADDEITGPFILNKFLYVSTKFRLFRLNYTGGNPDWQYIQVKNFGFVPRTIKVFTLKQGQVAVGLDWSRRLRAFDGYDDQIISDNVENNNDYCEFAMENISLTGSGLLISNAEFDPIEQEYRLNVAIGAQSTQTTHAMVLNARTLSIYPYSNQPYNTICVAESAGRQFLMAVDRSGYIHILNSGNLDISTPINEIYDSPLLFTKSPSEVTKNRQINFFFANESCGTIYYQEAFDFNRIFSPMRSLRNHLGETELKGNESTLQILRTVDLPSVQNVYQYRLTSSAGTANPWTITHFDLFNTFLGYGRTSR